MKNCRNCGVTREITEFRSNGYSKKGTKTYKPNCKFCDTQIRKNQLKPITIMVRGKPVQVESEAHKKFIASKKKRNEKNKEKMQERNKQYWQNMDIERKQAIIRRINLLAKKRKCMNS